jgi:hypothetical protein
MSGLEPAADDSIIQPSITKLLSLAELRVGGNPDAEVRRFPPGFGSLSALTSLTICKVRDTTNPKTTACVHASVYVHAIFVLSNRNPVQSASKNGAAHES